MINFVTRNVVYIILIAAIAVLTFFLLQKPEKEFVTIKVPVVMEVEIPQKVYTFPPSELPKPKTVKPRPKSVVEYKDADEKEKDSLYDVLSAVRTYVEKYTTDKAEVEVTSEVQGFLLRQVPKVTVYPDTITVTKTITTDVEIPKRNQFYLGAQMGAPILNVEEVDPIFGAAALFKNKKDRILSLSYNTQNVVMVGYYFKL